jgi:hypothetical protein
MATRSASTSVQAVSAPPGRKGRHVIDLTTSARPAPRMAEYEAAFGPLSSLHQHLLPVDVGRRGMTRLRALVVGRARA